MISSRDRQLLEDMLLEARRAVKYLGGSDSDGLEIDDYKAHAVLHAMQTVGEAAKCVSEELKAQMSHVPWHAPVGMRHILVHAYREVSLMIVAETVRNDVPILIGQLERFLAENPEE